MRTWTPTKNQAADRNRRWLAHGMQGLRPHPRGQFVNVQHAKRLDFHPLSHLLRLLFEVLCGFQTPPNYFVDVGHLRGKCDRHARLETLWQRRCVVLPRSLCRPQERCHGGCADAPALIQIDVPRVVLVLFPVPSQEGPGPSCTHCAGLSLAVSRTRGAADQRRRLDRQDSRCQDYRVRPDDTAPPARAPSRLFLSRRGGDAARHLRGSTLKISATSSRTKRSMGRQTRVCAVVTPSGGMLLLASLASGTNTLVITVDQVSTALRRAPAERRRKPGARPCVAEHRES